MKELVTRLRNTVMLPTVLMDFVRFRRLAKIANRAKPLWRDCFPCPFDRTQRTGFDRHYIYHTAWAARVLSQTRPARHVDFSSSLYFVGIVSAFLPVEHYDYRPPDLVLEGLKCGGADLTQLPFADDSLASLSCMHVIEHVGLGRYGDPLDPDGDRKAAGELSRVLEPGGDLLVAVPVGRPRIQMNAHRIYSLREVESLFPKLTVREFSLIPGRFGEPVLNAGEARVAVEEYGCGCFWFRKPL